MKIIRQKSVGVGIYLKKMVGGWFLEFRSAHPLQFSGLVPPSGSMVSQFHGLDLLRKCGCHYDKFVFFFELLRGEEDENYLFCDVML